MISRRSKIALIVVTSLVMMFATLVFAVQMLVSRQDFELVRQKLAARVESSTGFELEITGPLELPYSLLPTVIFHQVVLSNPRVGTGGNLLIAKDLRIAIEMIPLLRGEVVIRESSLAGVDLDLVVDEDGYANWISDGASDRSPPQLEIYAIDVADINLTYRNLRTGVTLNGHADQLNLEAPAGHGPIAMTLSTEYNRTPVHIRGRLGSSEEILTGKGFSVDLSLDIGGPDVILMGRVGQIEPGNVGSLRLQAEGNNLSELAELFDFRIPPTGDYSLATTLSSVDGAISASDIDADIDWQNSQLAIGGSVKNIVAWSGLDLVADVSGQDLSEVSRLVEVASLPHTDSYVLSGEIRGDWPTLAVSRVTASLTREQLTLNLAGSTDNLADLTGIDLDVTMTGTDLASVPEFSPLDLPATDSFEIEGSLSGSASRLSITELKAVAGRGQHQMTLSGDVDDVARFGGINWQFSITGGDLSELNAIITLDFPSTQNYRMAATLAGDGPALSAREVLIEGTAPGVRFDLSGVIGRIVELRDADLEVLISIDDLSRLSPYFETVLPESEPIKVTGRLTGSAPDLRLEGITGRSGGNLVHGSVNLKKSDRVGFVGSVTSGAIDLRPYLTTAVADTEARAASANDRIFSDKPFDFTSADLLDAQIELESLEFTLLTGNLIVDRATLNLKQGDLTIEPMELSRGDSAIKGHFRLDRQARPEFDIDLSIENIELGAFLNDLGIRQNYEGKFDLTANLQSRGNSVQQVMANLDGEFAAFVSEARIPQVSLSLWTPDLILGLLPGLQRRDDLVVNCAMSQLDVEDGIVDLKVLYLDAERMHMFGEGTIDLRAEKLDLRLSPRPRRSSILAHNIDIVVAGPLSEPEVSSVGAGKAVVRDIGKYALLGPTGLLLPTERLRKHPCVASLREYQQRQ